MYIAITIILILIVFFIFVRLGGKDNKVDFLKSKAQTGEVYYQIELAKQYMNSENNEEENYKEAQFWLDKAISQGSGKAANLLAQIYSKSTNPDYVKALGLFDQSIKYNVPQQNIISYLNWLVNYSLLKEPSKTKFNQFLQALEMKSKANICFAQFFLAEMYINGMGLPVNMEKAVYFYEQAANQGDLEAHYNLYYIYYDSDSEMHNVEKAFTHLVIAAKGSLQPAYNLLSSFAEKSDLLAYNSGIDTELKILLNVLLNFVENEDKNILKVFIGLMYANGSGTEEDPAKAFSWYEKAALQGHLEAKYMVGSCYEKGFGVKKDLEKALEWYKKASGYLYADQGAYNIINANRK